MTHLTRRISPLALFALSINAIIGSGWLFAPFYVAKIAGSGAIVAWLIGGAAAMLISFTFAELSCMLPVAGGSAHIPQLSHGPLVSYILSWLAWISSAILVPIEVQAVLQYASLSYPSLMVNTNGTPVLSLIGYAWAALLMMLLCVMNMVSYKGLMRSNAIIFTFKITIILLAIVSIMHARFEPSNFNGLSAMIGSKAGWQSILSAVATGGIILGFNGFKTGTEMAGETKNLRLAIPLSTAGAVGATLLLYLALQVGFIGALSPNAMAGGWDKINFAGDNGPLVGLAALLGLALIVKLLYVNSVVSPMGAALIYVTSTARILYAMSKMGYVPAFLSKLNKHHLPTAAIIFNFIIGMLSFLPLPGWQAMVNFLVSVMVISYAMGPVALMSLRYSLPDKARPFRLPAASVMCFIAFYFCNLFSYWTGWETMSRLGWVLAGGVALFFIAKLRGKVMMHWKDIMKGSWILAYLIGLVGISWLGAFGGQHLIPFGWDFIVIALFSLSIYWLAIKCRSIHQLDEVLEGWNLHPVSAESH